MRPTTLLLSASAGALIAFGAVTGTAFATTPAPVPPSGSVSPAVPTRPSVQEAGAVMVSSDRAAPGQTVRISGSCPTPAAGAPQPTLTSVTSEGFRGPETFSKTDPFAFDGSAVVADAPGSHQVLLTCSNGTATTSFTVTGSTAPTGGVAPSTPAAGGGGGGAHERTGSGDGGVVVEESQPQEESLPWGWIAAGGLVVAGAGAAAGTAYVRRRPTGADAPTERTHV